MISARWRGGVVSRRSIQPAHAAAIRERLLCDRRDAQRRAPDSPIDARATVFHNGGARVMGSAQALPERIDKDTGGAPPGATSARRLRRARDADAGLHLAFSTWRACGTCRSRSARSRRRNFSYFWRRRRRMKDACEYRGPRRPSRRRPRRWRRPSTVCATAGSFLGPSSDSRNASAFSLSSTSEESARLCNNKLRVASRSAGASSRNTSSGALLNKLRSQIA